MSRDVKFVDEMRVSSEYQEFCEREITHTMDAAESNERELECVQNQDRRSIIKRRHQTKVPQRTSE